MNEFNLLGDALITVAHENGETCRYSLPGVLDLMMADKVVDFPRLQPHQVPAWHVFLVQLIVMAKMSENETSLRKGENWAQLLRSMTNPWLNSDWQIDAAWCLISDSEEPAFLQAPQPEGLAKFKNVLHTPDALDFLITSKNHEIKSSKMSQAEAEDWIFALVSLQTQEGVMGAGKYGIARMNGGYSSRCYMFSMQEGARYGAHLVRDVNVLLANKDGLKELAETIGFAKHDKVPLAWLLPWSKEDTSLELSRLHPLFIEVCRRIRLVRKNGKLVVREDGSKSSRVNASALNGNLGDPWVPVEILAEETPKALSITADGFSYKKVGEILFGSTQRNYKIPLLGKATADERQQPSQIVFAGLSRGMGKTEGFHKRVILVPADTAQRLFAKDVALAAIAQSRIRLVSDVSRRCLRPALLFLVQKGVSKIDEKKPTNDSLVGPLLRRFDHAVDQVFFPMLWQAAAAEADVEAAWQQKLAYLARQVFRAGAESIQKTEERTFIAQARALNVLEGRLRQLLPKIFVRKDETVSERETL